MFMNILPKHSASTAACVVCLLGFLTPSLAQAGFDWAPPPVVVQQPAAPAEVQQSGPLTPEPDSALPVPVGAVETAPVVKAEPTSLPTPEVTAERALSAAPTQPVAEPSTEPLIVDNTTPAPVIDQTTALPLPAQDAKVAPAPAVEPVLAPAAAAIPSEPVVQAEAPVEGFGKDIPLAIALREIAPSKYAYSFNPRDLGGAKISWRGGKPWREVLQSALTPLNLTMVVTDNVILISQKHTPVSAVSQSAPAPVSAATEEPMPLVEAPKSDVVSDAVSAPAPAEKAPLVTGAVDMKSVLKWEARPGTTLRKTLESWSKLASVELNWSTAYDYPIQSSFYFDGTFSDAVASLLSSYGGESQKPKGRFYPNLPEGPSVLMIN